MVVVGSLFSLLYFTWILKEQCGRYWIPVNEVNMACSCKDSFGYSDSINNCALNYLTLRMQPIFSPFIMMKAEPSGREV